MITVDPEKPEKNGPFLVYPVPDFPGIDGRTEHKGFFIVLPVDGRFLDMDDKINWWTGNVSGEKHLLFKVPAWPYFLWPQIGGGQMEAELAKQLPQNIQKSITDSHSLYEVAAKDQSAEFEERKWKYFLLDFSHLPGVGKLTSKPLFADATDKEVLDQDVFEIPFLHDDMENVMHYETVLGFKVAHVDDQGGRKIARSEQKKSAAALKREQARASRNKVAAKKGGDHSMSGA